MQKRTQTSWLHWLILSIVIIAIIGIAITTILVVRNQGITQGLITLTIISIVVGMIIGLLTLMVNSFQWLSSKTTAGHSLSTVFHSPAQPPGSIQQDPSSTGLPHPLTAFPSVSSLTSDPPITSQHGRVERIVDVNNSTHQSIHREDWGEAPHIENFYGRDKECADLKRWIVDDHCRLVALLGIGGIGKTSLAAKLVEQVKDDFEYVFWRSLQNAPPLQSILKSCFQFLSNYQGVDLPEDIDGQLTMLLQYLREHRCLLVLDNVESVLQTGDRCGLYREEYQEYGALIQRIGEAKHLSCLLLTSREKPKEVAQLEGKTSPVRSMALSGLEQAEGRELLKDKGIVGSDETLTAIVQLYSGNPLALKLASEPIQEVFGGDVASFLKNGKAVFGDIRDPLDLQFTRLSELERNFMYWLAIEREAVSLDDLREDMVDSFSKGDLLVAIASLRRRSMVESTGAMLFTLQPVIMEYVTDRFLEQIYGEINSGTLKLFVSHALIKAQTKDYVRESQVCLILAPIAERLLSNLGREGTEKKLLSIVSTLRETQSQRPGYAAGNILNLLIHLQVELHGYDFSHLTVWQAYLQGVVLNNVNFAHSNLARSVFTEPFAGILSVALSSDGELLAAGGTNGEIRLWQIKSTTPLSPYQGHVGWIYSIAFSPDSKFLVSGGEDQTVRLWDVSTGQCLMTLQGHTNRIWSVAFSPDSRKFVSGSHDQTVRLWDVSTGQCLMTLQGHTNRVWSVAFSPDGKMIASGSEDRTVRLWDVSTGQVLKTLEGHTSLMKSVAFSPDSKMLASGSDDQTIRLWDVDTGECLNTLRDHLSRVRSIAFSPDGRSLASGSDDQTVRLWDVGTGRCLRTLQDHTNWVGAVAFSSDGALLASGSEDQTVRLWDVGTGQCLKTLHGYAHLVESVAFSPDGKLLVSGSDDMAVRLWDISTGRCMKTLYGHNGRVRSVAVNPDGKIFASGSDDQTVRLWNISTGESLTTLCGHTNRVWSVTFSPDGRSLASASEDQTVRIWEVSTGRELTALRGHTNWIWSVAFSPDGKTLASGSGDQTVGLWKVSTGERIATLYGHTDRVWSVAFNSDGKMLASGSEDQTIKLWDISSSKCLRTLNGHTGLVRSVAFSPDGSILASGSDDQTIRLWRVSTGRCLTTLHEHTNQVRSIAFDPNPDSRIFASSSHDSTIKIWDRQTYECLRTLKSDKPYERMNITDVRGLTDGQKAMLKALGAVEDAQRNPVLWRKEL